MYINISVVQIIKQVNEDFTKVSSMKYIVHSFHVIYILRNI